MGICSRVDSIDNICFHPMKTGKIYRGVNVVKVDRKVVVQDAEGKLYCDHISGKAFGLANWSWLSSILRALVKLKVIEQSAYHQHMKDAKEESERTSRCYASKDLVKLEKDHGLKLTAEMKKFIKDNPPPRW